MTSRGGSEDWGDLVERGINNYKGKHEEGAVWNKQSCGRTVDLGREHGFRCTLSFKYFKKIICL